MLVTFAAAIFAADSKPPPPTDRAAQSRVHVTLVSDGETWISIPNVHPPSKAQTVTLSLAPGEYDVIGRRKGFRDVEKRLRVQSGSAPITLTVICTVSREDRSPLP